MKVNVTQLRRTEGSCERYSFNEKFPSLTMGNEEYIFLEPLEVVMDAVNTGKSILVKGRVCSKIEVNCSRCLKEFSCPIDFEFEDEWLPLEFAAQGEEENGFIFEKDEFIVDERILEHIYLHLPMRFTCSKKCKGLCPKCGVDRNIHSCVCSDEVIDPRLEILSKWNKGV